MSYDAETAAEKQARDDRGYHRAKAAHHDATATGKALVASLERLVDRAEHELRDHGVAMAANALRSEVQGFLKRLEAITPKAGRTT